MGGPRVGAVGGVGREGGLAEASGYGIADVGVGRIRLADAGNPADAGLTVERLRAAKPPVDFLSTER